MKKVEVTLQNVKEKIAEFYDERVWHFITLNGVALAEEKTEVQWIFSKYESLDDVVIYFAEINQEDTVPSVVEIIPSAIISQRELVDMFGIKVEDSTAGLYLDKDSLSMPLSSCGIKA